MRTAQTPGVYIRDVDTAPPARLRLDITGIVGQTERGPLHYPQAITSWGQFRDIFGDFVGFSYVPYAVFGFFQNGGERCYLVRVAHESATRAAVELVDARQEPAIEVEAIDAGMWGNAITVRLDERSTDDLVLTELTRDVEAGQNAVTLQSVAGLVGADVVASEHADTVTLVDRRDPFRRETRRIQSIDLATHQVTLSPELSRAFAAGSRVLGKGFTLTFRYQRRGTVVREEVFDNLSLRPGHERYYVSIINGTPEEKDYIQRIRNGHSILVRVEDLCRHGTPACARPRGVEAQTLVDGTDGPHTLPAPYYTGYDNGAYFRPPLPGADAVRRNGTETTRLGLATFEGVEDIGLIAIPDLILADIGAYFATLGVPIPKAGVIFGNVPVAALDLDNLKIGQRDMLRHCEIMGDRFAILDAPRGVVIGQGANRIEDWPSHLQLLPTAHDGALYYPWIKENAADFDGRELFIPPSGHLAGIYARTERERGIGKAPANEIVRGVVALEFDISNTQQDLLNPRGVNCLRLFPGRGLRVWGARTLSRDPQWRYVNVRRVCLSIIKHILINLQFTVFEPNDRRLRDGITASLTLFFQDLFASGALAGATPEEAFFVKCDEETNPPEVVDRGEVVTQIGFAPAHPAEFVLVTIKRTAASLTVSEG